MDEVSLLHTAARRFLMSESARWSARYAETAGPWSGKYSAQDLDTFPRYQVLNAILEEVERIRPEECASFETMRDRLTDVGARADSIFTAGHAGDIEQRAMEEERTRFIAFIEGVAVSDLAAVESLPYRRVLSEAEVEKCSTRLGEAWGAERGQWFPQDGAARGDVVEFDAPKFRREVGPSLLQEILSRHGISRVWELREYGPSYEIELGQLNPAYTGVEGFWFSDRCDWVVYASHENSIAVGGVWLLDEIKHEWPGWDRGLWNPISS